MTIIHHPSVLRSYLQNFRNEQKLIGFVPTMGALHKGHLGLIDEAKKTSDISVCSIFVNPTQFNVRSDFEKYPNLLPADIRLLESSGCHVLFLPGVSDIYPEGTEQLEHYDLGYLESVLEGRFRPGHFQGVCQVMSRLLTAVEPDKLVMGQKDYQQCLVVRRLMEIIKSKAELISSGTRRDADGLAMSSRNLRLSANEREQAPHIYKSLLRAEKQLQPGQLKAIKDSGTKYLETKGFRVDYFEIADAHSLSLLETWDGNTSVVVLVAAFLGDVRLIDNLVVAHA